VPCFQALEELRSIGGSVDSLFRPAHGDEAAGLMLLRDGI